MESQQFVRRRRGTIPAQVRFQQRAIKVVPADPCQRVLQGRDRSDNPATEVLQHLLDQHCNQHFILDNKDVHAC